MPTINPISWHCGLPVGVALSFSQLGQRIATRSAQGRITVVDAPLGKFWFSGLNLEMTESALALQGDRSMASEGVELAYEEVSGRTPFCTPGLDDRWRFE